MSKSNKKISKQVPKPCNNEIPFCFSILVPSKLDTSKIEYLDFTFDVSCLQCIIEPISIPVHVDDPCDTKECIPSKALINQIRIVGCIQIFAGLFPLVSRDIPQGGYIPNPAGSPPFLSSGLGSVNGSEVLCVDRVICYTDLDNSDPCPDLSESTFTAYTSTYKTDECGNTLIPIKGSIFLPNCNKCE
ncbi:hypothetical protein P4414_27050 [Bacillus thuringiensis]|nr:hypothetical protein [Bacillus thuringiensis]